MTDALQNRDALFLAEQAARRTGNPQTCTVTATNGDVFQVELRIAPNGNVVFSAPGGKR